LQNLEELQEWVGTDDERQNLHQLREWSDSFFERYQSVFDARVGDGFIRECHGDLHLGNIVRIGDEPMLFDCIEFRKSWRKIDVINEIAFLSMDLDVRGGSRLSLLFLNRYLEVTGDYRGMSLFPYYYVYRALVRYKIGLIQQQNMSDNSAGVSMAVPSPQQYLQIANQHTRHRAMTLSITHGFSGSGKTAITGQILSTTGCIRIRSDIERKRLHGLKPGDSGGASAGEGIYTEKDTHKTYEHLLLCADGLLQADFSVLVDATFLKMEMRNRFRKLADSHGCKFVVLDFYASESELQQRINHRIRQGSDASDADVAILANQITHHDPLRQLEMEDVIKVNTEGASIDVIASRLIKQLSI
jgi:predicted kinase